MEEKLDLRDTLAVLQRRWRLIAGFMVCGLALAVAFLLAVTPKYSAEATLKFDPRQFQITSSNASLGNDLFDRLIAGEIAAVRSPDVLRTVMTSLKLWDDPELTEPTLYEMIAGPIGNLLSPGGPRLLDPELRPLANFEKRLWVDQPDKTNLITISYESLDRAKAPAVANAIANTYLAYHLEHQLGDSPLAAKWLNERRAELREQWRRSEQLLEQYKGENLKDQQMARVNEQLVLANAAAEEARARVEQIRRLMDSRNYTQLANAVKSELMTLLRDRLAAASQKQASLGATLLPAHPSMREVQSEVASLNADILAEARRTLEYRTATEREQLVTASLQRTIGSVQASGDKLVKLRELERNAASDKTIYEAFLNRSNEALEQSTGQFVNFRLIKKAEAPVRPSFPSKVKVLLLARCRRTASSPASGEPAADRRRRPVAASARARRRLCPGGALRAHDGLAEGRTAVRLSREPGDRGHLRARGRGQDAGGGKPCPGRGPDRGADAADRRQLQASGAGARVRHQWRPGQRPARCRLGRCGHAGGDGRNDRSRHTAPAGDADLLARPCPVAGVPRPLGRRPPGLSARRRRYGRGAVQSRNLGPRRRGGRDTACRDLGQDAARSRR
jgi:uncharacterized protein involved in exopolysaccharide biosynthesis